MIYSQPKTLPLFFLGEFIEKFSFWGLQSLLVLYLTKILHLSAHDAYTVFGAFTALTFTLSILGGFLADKLFGFYRAMIMGALLIIAGNVFLSLKGLHYTYVGLATVAMGVPLFTTSNTNLLGTLYEKDDLRRNRGFIIFYMATNLGGALGPVIYGLISITYGWRFCFSVSAVALGIWLILLLFSSKQFKSKGLPPKTIKTNIPNLSIHLLSCCLLLVIVILFLMRYIQYTGVLLGIIGVASLFGLILTAIKKQSKERKAIFILLSMMFFCLSFFAIEFQVNSSLLLFADQHVDRNIFNWVIPANTFASLEPFFVIILAPIFTLIWKLLARKEPTPFIKITIGLLFASASFVVFSIASHLAVTDTQKISILWLLAGNLLLGAGEILIMPTVIASITNLAPTLLRGTLMGMLYLSLAFAGYLAGMIANMTTKEVTKASFIAYKYAHVYNNIAYIALLIAIISGMFYMFTKKMFKHIE